MNSKSFRISLAVITALSFSLTGCGEENDTEPPIISNVKYLIDSFDNQSNIASVHISASIDKEDTTSIYDNNRSLNFQSGNAENGYINLSSGKHILKICAKNQDAKVCSNEKTYFIYENLRLSSYKTYLLKNKSNGLSNNGKDLIYGTLDGKIYKLKLDSKNSTQISDVSEEISGLAFVNNNSYFYSSLESDTIKKLTLESNSTEEISSLTHPDGIDFFNNKIYTVTSYPENSDKSSILTILNAEGTKDKTLDTGIDIVGISHTNKYLYLLSETGSIYQTNPTTGESNKIFINKNLFDSTSGYNGLEAITVLNNYIYLSYVQNHSIYKINLDLASYE